MDGLHLQGTPDGVQFRVRVTPRARQSEVTGVMDGALVVRVAAPPADGAANEALLALLSERLGVPVRRVRLIAGAASRNKVVSVTGLQPDEIRQRLAARRRA